MKKLSSREVTWFAQGFTASKAEQHLNPDMEVQGFHGNQSTYISKNLLFCVETIFGPMIMP